MTSTVLPLIDEPDTDRPTAGTSRPGCGELRASSGERLPLKALALDARIVGLTATSSVRQRFVNHGTAPIEATYVFPLPPRAGVTDFAATLAGRKVVGILKERAQARLTYEEAIAAGQRAAIVEEERADVFTVRVGNLGPGEEAIVELVLSGPLEVQEGEATFRFPLVVAPRYTAGLPLEGDQTGTGTDRDTDAVPDASRVTPPRLQPGDARPELAITVSVDGAGLPVSSLRTSLHSRVEGATGTTGVVRVQPGARADRDFLLRFALDRSALATSAVVVEDGDGQAEGTWAVTLIPPVEVASEPRDVVVVLDRSGSMAGWKIVAARRAAGRIVDMLDGADRFAVLGFDYDVERPRGWSSLVEASDRNRFAAASWLGSLEARGGTEMARPLVEAADLLARSGPGRRATLVLVTDGQITGEDQVLSSLEPRLGATTVHCVGVDRAVNAGFLDRLARRGRGRFQLVESEERLDEVMVGLARTIGRPSLRGVSVTGHGIEVTGGSVTPAPAPDAFAGVPCVVSGRYRGPLDDGAALAISAGDGDVTRTVVLAPVRSTAAAVRTVWARARLRDLEDAYACGHEEGLDRRIVEHSIRFGVLSRFTAFVAVDPERTDGEALDEVTQPVEVPFGWAMPHQLQAAGGSAAAGPVPLMTSAAAVAPPQATAGDRA
ncbi:MAG: VWA domain-containing protein, partial [Acidimicrobiales bacterium]|nr:VWA domain-containing protein [Acidimicrobiales bacterium]